MVYTRRAPEASRGETRLVHVLDSWGESPPKVIGLVDYHATGGQTVPFILNSQKVSLCFLQREEDKHLPSWKHLVPQETRLGQRFCS